MALSKHEESALLQVYDNYWQSYLTGDISTLASLLADDYTQIGSVETEVFDNKKDAVHFIETTIDQVAGKLEMRNRVKKIEPVGPIILITEQTDLYVLTEGDWVYYAKFRASSFLQRNDGQWKFIHQHSSMPDIRAEEGENIATEKISRENIELRDAIKRRTIELEQKNLELAMEASLERVRTVAMGMRKPDDFPGICEVLFNELRSMGFTELRNAMINIHNDEKSTFINYDYSEEIGPSINHLNYNIHPVIEKQIKQIRSTHDAFSETVFSGQDLEDWKAFRKGIGEKDDPRIDNVSALYYYFYSIGTGAIGISTFGPISSEKLEQLKRFRNVFEFAYRRYMDVTQAEAQAREAQIEASLERIRASSLAMRDSSALGGIIFQLYGELTRLDAKLDRCFIMIVNPENKGITWWMAGQEGLLAENGFFVQMNQYPSHLMYLDHCDKRKKKWAYLFEGKEKSDCDQFIFTQTELARLPEPIKEFMSAAKEVHLSGSSDQFGSIVTGSFEPLPDEQQEIISRFTIAFNQAYIRFLDLQKAEAQAREATIEAALERVRSKTMAMHNSLDVGDTVAAMFDQLRNLGVTTNRCGILIFSNTGFTEVWTAKANTEGKAALIIGYLDLTIHPMLVSVINAWKNKEEFYSYELAGEDIRNYYTSINNFPGYPTRFNLDDLPASEIHSDFFFPEGAVFAFTAEPVPTESALIFKRFAGVFGQTYRRYLDLQKAEAQARESQIQLALERVRARTMAMQQSSELSEVVFDLYQQMQYLGFDYGACTITLIDQSTGDTDWWMAGLDNRRYPNRYHVNYFSHPGYQAILDEWKRGNDFGIIEIKGESKKQYDQILFLQTDFAKLSDDIKSLMTSFESLVYSMAFMRYGCLSFGPNPISEHEKSILHRFAKVFEQTYTRFLDLQKAEAQAREAQIEAALERVRSRSMGMQKSDELKEVIKLVYQQLIHLKINLDHSGFVVDYTMGGDWHFWIADEQDIPSRITHPYFESVWADQFNEAKEKGADFFVTHLNFEEKNKFYNELLSYVPGLPEASKDFYLNCPGLAASTVLFDNISLYIENFSGIPYTDEENNTLMRFGKVFQQTYTRFLDLQKAEVQARESHIELGLERVRARAMAMQDSGELSDLVATLLHELTKLDFSLTFCIINIYNEPDHSNMVWAANPQEGKAPESYYMKFEDYPFHHAMMREWKARTPKYVYVMEGKEKEIYDDYLYTDTEFRRFPEEVQTANRALDRYVASFVFSQFGGLQTVGDKPLSDENLEILYRFGKVFDQTYTRFLDLQKAEAQAREAKIEAALERVRSRAMGMQQSSELSILIELVYKEMGMLDFILQRCFIMIFNQSNNSFTWWMASNEAGSSQRSYFIQYHEQKPHLAYIKGWKEQNPRWEYTLYGKEKEEWDAFLFKETELAELPPPIIANMIGTPRAYLHSSFSNFGCICAASVEPLKGDYFDIINRFSKVFDQTYTRFLDLQKAEAQAREATIETSLERMRAKTMAMHSSDDVVSTVATMFTELEKLGVENLRGGIAIVSEDQTMEVWSVTNLADSKIVKGVGTFDMKAHPLWQNLFESWKNKEECYVDYLSGTGKENYINILNKNPHYLSQPIGQLPDLYFQGYNFGEGYIWSNSLQQHVQENKQVMKKFAAVFSLTFRRYLDLKKAEAQAREATIETSLEKVRGKAMAMQNSNDLITTASIVFTEIKNLGIQSFRTGVGLLTKANRNTVLYSATSTDKGDNLSLVGSVMLEGHEVLSKIYDCWVTNEDYFPVLKGEQLKTYVEKLNPTFKLPAAQTEDYIHYGIFLPFSEGMFYSWSDKAYAEAEIKILLRFRAIIDLTFRRFVELQKAEANALEAVRSASLDRVRAETASMRTTADLEKITPMIWNELSTLGVPFIRCGVFIMDEAQELIHTFLSTPDGKAIASFHLPYKASADLWETVTNWRKKEMYQQYWDEAAFADWTNNLKQQGFISSTDSYATEHRPENLYLHFLPFMQGMLYVGNDAGLRENDLQLVQNLADAFSTAYARYEDFNRLEAAKEQVDKTLNDLKQAQSQLVQAEKMASLGELTAGIAHEIQNPLNFVNNFSEVSNELIEEMQEEMENGNTEEVKSIISDIRNNLEKINLHGKRADAIVKGMLQHSRTTSGEKQPTDINALADEYLRLAYHGLRAKDKSFNATLKTDLDTSIGRINIVSQDIGRVVLNLINNALYAVNERSKKGEGGYIPAVAVSTLREGNNVRIVVSDNGDGIPENIKEKIFQPFFTTKPTGQGTGLGLSLAYDIVKAHGGNINVISAIDGGSSFVLHLPIV